MKAKSTGAVLFGWGLTETGTTLHLIVPLDEDTYVRECDQVAGPMRCVQLSTSQPGLRVCRRCAKLLRTRREELEERHGRRWAVKEQA